MPDAQNPDQTPDQIRRNPDMTPDPDPGSAPVVSILVISYNTREMTLDCLRSLVAETTIPHEVIVVDNASPDGSAAAVAEAFPPEAFPQIRVIAETANHGFAKGNNIAARYARGEYLLLLNPDTVVLDGAIDRLVAFAERRPEAMVWGGRTLYGDMSLNEGSCFSLQTLWSIFCRTSALANAFPRSGLFNSENYGGWDRSDEREVGYVCGCLFLMKRDLWNALGGFDLTFVMYGEETDLCHRARALGAKPRITPEATIIHYVGASSAKRADKHALVLKSKVTLARRYLPAWQQGPATFLLRMWPWGRMVAGRAAAALTGRASIRAAADRWAAVWASRADWQGGFPERPHPAPSPAEPASPAARTA
jgi:GT2 family glycosyltransferase